MVQGSFPSCGAVPCYKGWRDCWDLIQILLKSRQGSLHESMCIHAGLGGGEAFLSTSNCTKNSAWMRINLAETLQRAWVWRSVAAIISGTYWKSWMLSLHCKKLMDALPLPMSGRLPASPVTQFPHHGKLWGQASTKGTAWGLLEHISAARCGEHYYLHLDLITQCVYTIVHMHTWLPWWQLYSDMKWP